MGEGRCYGSPLFLSEPQSDMTEEDWKRIKKAAETITQQFIKAGKQRAAEKVTLTRSSVEEAVQCLDFARARILELETAVERHRDRGGD